MLRDVRKDLGGPRAGLAVLRKLERRLQALAAGREEAGLRISAGERRAITLSQFRFVIEGVDLRGTARLKKPNDGFRFRSKLRWPGG